MSNERRPGFGLYYSPHAGPYRQADLEAYLPLLQAVGAAWLVVRSSARRAIPEFFLQGLKQGGVEPVVHFAVPLHTPAADIVPLLEVYARWGVRHVVFFDRPNQRAAWGRAWHQPDLPARFLDLFIPLAEAALQQGLTVYFPPLAVGGDYWDLAFLRAALEGLRRRAPLLAGRLTLSAYAWAQGRSLDWGRGGPEVWPQARPYFTPPDSEDHRGFRIFEWYAAEAQAVWGRTPSVFLLAMGERYGHDLPDDAADAVNQAIARLFREGELPPAVAGGAFWVLTAGEGGAAAAEAWVSPQGKARPILEALRLPRAHAFSPTTSQARHYVLLPRGKEGVPPHYLSAALPWLQQGRATVGFRVDEALAAQQVTVIGQPEDFPPQVREALEKAPRVQWMALPGMEVASFGAKETLGSVLEDDHE